VELRGRDALVLGATGFLGSNLVVALEKAGARVRAASRTEPRDLDPELGGALRRSERVRFDLCNAESVARLVPEEGFVFLAAGVSGALTSLARATEDLETNGRGVLNLLEALRAKRSKAKVIFPSSQLAANPLSLYAAHKALGETYGRVYEQAHGIPFVSLRIANPYGPRQRRAGGAYGLVRYFLDLALQGKEVPVYGDGSQRRGYVYIDDVVRAFLLAAEKGQGVYNVGADPTTTVRAMAEAVVRAAGRGRVTSVAWPEDARRVEPGDVELDLSRTRADLGWSPCVGLDEGLARTVRFLRGS